MPSQRLLTMLSAALSLLTVIFLAACSDPQPSNAEPTASATYTGSEDCATCHQVEYEAWNGSHHQQAMQHASVDTVKGDFAEVEFHYGDEHSRFYIIDSKYYVETPGPDGVVAEYEVLYTFGTTPLQQYIVAFPGGRLQMVPIAWDVIEKKWFHLQEALQPQHGEWIYWTEGGMNWNSMCADCHTTGLEKNFDVTRQSYNTQWSAINVSCEACHGPGSQHIAAAKSGDLGNGAAAHLDMLAGEPSRQVVDKCGRCHSRRQQLTQSYRHDSDELLDHYLPSVLQNGLYHSDGQILDEVFVYGSFTQSKMYHNDVSCINCHQAHSVRLRKQGNALCAQCHLPDQYDTPAHHHHEANDGAALKLPAQSAGNQCVDCHMPGKVYMGNDFRRDHSLRRPRPDLSLKYGTPNACIGCHIDETNQWAASTLIDWFGEIRQAHFSEVLALAESNPGVAISPLVKLLNDRKQPAIARATAAHILSPLALDDNVSAALQLALKDPEPLVRTMAARAFAELPLSSKLHLLINILDDPVRSVRIAAASSLSEAHENDFPSQQQSEFRQARAEYLESLAINADFPSGQHQIGIDQQTQGEFSLAEQSYKQTLAIDNRFNASRLNLAQLYYQQGRRDEAVETYEAVLELEPNAAPAHYALGLLMAELGDMAQAEHYLEAAGRTGNNPRAWYNLAVLRQQQGKTDTAEQAYLQALNLTPGNPEFIQGLVSLYAQQGKWQQAYQLVTSELAQDPENNHLQNLLRQIQGSSAR
ncbi:MAG: tetratricopeptide repeat protein [Pseudomonadales bacterium]